MSGAVRALRFRGHLSPTRALRDSLWQLSHPSPPAAYPYRTGADRPLFTQLTLEGVWQKGKYHVNTTISQTFVAKTERGASPRCLAERLSGPVETFQNSL
jgi:hypothetical protein